MHALLFREWKGRVKGRDWYDWLWLVRRGAELNLDRLAIHLRASGFFTSEDLLTRERFEQLMFEKIAALDLNSALNELRPFITDLAQIADWSKEMLCHFVGATQTIKDQ
jgi:hypothetical protein